MKNLIKELETFQTRAYITLRSERKARKISQEVLAIKAGIHRANLSAIESGSRKTSVEMFLKLFKALEEL